MPVIDIYTRQFCSYCTMAKRLLERRELAFVEHDATGNPEMRAEMIQRAKGAATFPQIFIDGRHIGGCDDLYALEASGGLDRLVKA
ncbi:MAG TPA: glutaredoxin 3 [Bauldia sp.]|nr:glutaredoxin 3 [Bauldia sp.]